MSMDIWGTVSIGDYIVNEYGESRKVPDVSREVLVPLTSGQYSQPFAKREFLRCVSREFDRCLELIERKKVTKL